MNQISPSCKVKQTFATTATPQQRVQQPNLSKPKNRNMKPIQKSDACRKSKVQKNHQPKTAGPKPVDVDAGSSSEPFVGPFSSDEFQWPPIEVPTRFRALSVATTLPRRRSAKPHAVLGVNTFTSLRGSAGLVCPRRPVPFPLSRVPSTHLLGVLVRIQAALGTDTPAVGTPVGTLVTKIQSSDCSAFAPVTVNSTSSVIQGSEVSNVSEANTQVLEQNVKLHPVLGICVPTRRRSIVEL